MSTVVGPRDGSRYRIADHHVVRDSNGNIIVWAGWDTETTDFESTLYISTDGGSTWTRGSQMFHSTVFNAEHHSFRIDGADRIHSVVSSISPNVNIEYMRGTIASDGTINKLIDHEVVYNPARRADIALDTVDELWCLGQTTETIMGTDYDRMRLIERTPGVKDSWTSRGLVFNNGEKNEVNPSLVVDGSDVKHMLCRVNGQNYETYSGGSFDGKKEIVSSDVKSNLALDGSDIPFFASGTEIWKRTGGTWSNDTYESTAADAAAVTFQDGEIQIVYRIGQNIYHNGNSFGSFVESDRTQILNGSDYRSVNARWSERYNNPPTTDVLDFVTMNRSTDEIEYEQVSFVELAPLALDTDASAVIQTDASGVLQTTGSG